MSQDRKFCREFSTTPSRFCCIQKCWGLVKAFTQMHWITTACEIWTLSKELLSAYLELLGSGIMLRPNVFAEIPSRKLQEKTEFGPENFFKNSSAWALNPLPVKGWCCFTELSWQRIIFYISLVKDPGDPISSKLNKTRRDVQKTKRQQVGLKLSFLKILWGVLQWIYLFLAHLIHCPLVRTENPSSNRWRIQSQEQLCFWTHKQQPQHSLDPGLSSSFSFQAVS